MGSVGRMMYHGLQENYTRANGGGRSTYAHAPRAMTREEYHAGRRGKWRDYGGAPSWLDALWGARDPLAQREEMARERLVWLRGVNLPTAHIAASVHPLALVRPLGSPSAYFLAH